jgi:hypothetical protein
MVSAHRYFAAGRPTSVTAYRRAPHRRGGLVLYNPANLKVERYHFRGAQLGTPFDIDAVDPGKAGFRRTSHDDVAFVGQVSEYRV